MREIIRERERESIAGSHLHFALWLNDDEEKKTGRKEGEGAEPWISRIIPLRNYFLIAYFVVDNARRRELSHFLLPYFSVSPTGSLNFGKVLKHVQYDCSARKCIKKS